MGDNRRGSGVRRWVRLMNWGKVAGCHQLPQRSLFFRGYQFPVCARCTGVIVGNATAYAAFFIYALPIRFCFIGCAIMFIDWLAQYVGIRASTNRRRLITGVIGGYALATLYCTAIKYAAQYLIKL